MQQKWKCCFEILVAIIRLEIGTWLKPLSRKQTNLYILQLSTLWIINSHFFHQMQKWRIMVWIFHSTTFDSHKPAPFIWKLTVKRKGTNYWISFEVFCRTILEPYKTFSSLARAKLKNMDKRIGFPREVKFVIKKFFSFSRDRYIFHSI